LDAVRIIRQALTQPIGSPQLTYLVKPGQSIAIILDDFTRKTPVAQFLPIVLDQLRSAGILSRDIRLVNAPGTHRPMMESELINKVGKKILAEYEVINIPSDRLEEMVFLGNSSNGIPAWVNRVVVEADVRIGLGMITPHSDAGFSGGAKIILPGVCSSATVEAFHAAGAFLGETQLGMEKSPTRHDLEEFVADRVPLDFIVNVVTTLDGDILYCIAGHPTQAHREGVKFAKEVFGVPIHRRYPIVIANCFPYDIDLWQSTKGAFCGGLATVDGGRLILVTAAPEGNSNYPMFPDYLGRDPQELKDAIKSKRIKHAHLAAESVKLGLLRKRVKLGLVSEGISQDHSKKMNIQYYPSVEDALADAVSELSPSIRKKSVCIIPQAGVTLPLQTSE
jgi:nickel-dependent lactate racemase